MFVFEKEKESEKRLIYVGYLKSKQCDCILSSLPVNVFFLRVLLTKDIMTKIWSWNTLNSFHILV